MDFFSWWVYILPIFAGLFLFGRIKGRYGKIDLFSWWTYGESTAWAIAGFGILYLIPYLFYEKILYWREVPLRNAPDGVTIADWWYEKTVPWESPVGFLLIVFLIVYGVMMKKDPKNQVHHKLAPYGLWLVIILLLFHFFGSQMGKGVEFGSSVVAKTKTATEVKASPYFTGDTYFRNEALSFWVENANNDRDAWDMIDTISRESGFIHFNPDGSVLQGKINPRDRGLHQINLDESADEIKEANCYVEELNCNFKVALLIYKKHGLKKWNAYRNIVKYLPISTKRIPVIPGEWSQVYNVKPNSNCFWTFDRPTKVRIQNGDEYDAGPGKVPNVNSPTQQYLISEGEPGEVVIECR